MYFYAFSVLNLNDFFFLQEKPQFPGSRSEYTYKLSFLDPEKIPGIPVYRVLNKDGQMTESSQDPKVRETTPVYLLL